MNIRDLGGRTALYLATKYGNFESVKILLAAKANPRVKTHSGMTALEVA